MIGKTVSPFLAPEDLGIDLEEDSEDVTDEEVAEAVDTDDREAFVKAVTEFIRGVGPHQARVELRRKGGILYCRASVDSQRRLFKVDWLRKG